MERSVHNPIEMSCLLESCKTILVCVVQNVRKGLVKMLNALDKLMLEKVSDLHEIPQGAFNIRKNGHGIQRNTTANIDIVTKQDKSGIDVIVKPYTKGESVHIPVIVTEENINDVVYNTLSLIHISEPTRLGMISYAVF